MSINVKFFQPVGAGDNEIDPLRILSVAGNIANDLDPRVLFTARGARASAYSEERTFSDPGSPNNSSYWRPGFRTDRVYVAPPLILATYQNTDGYRFYPCYQSGIYLFRVVSNRESNGTYTIIAEMQSNNGVGAPRAGGLLRINTIGRTY